MSNNDAVIQARKQNNNNNNIVGLINCFRGPLRYSWFRGIAFTTNFIQFINVHQTYELILAYKACLCSRTATSSASHTHTHSTHNQSIHINSKAVARSKDSPNYGRNFKIVLCRICFSLSVCCSTHDNNGDGVCAFGECCFFAMAYLASIVFHRIFQRFCVGKYWIRMQTPTDTYAQWAHSCITISNGPTPNAYNNKMKIEMLVSCLECRRCFAMLLGRCNLHISREEQKEKYIAAFHQFWPIIHGAMQPHGT